MTTNRKLKGSVLKSVRQAATDLRDLGFIDMHKMRQYKALCLEPVPSYNSDKIKKLRDRYRISQAVLAAVLNTSLSTVRQWEVGDKNPSGTSLKLLSILDRKGLDALI